MGTTSFLIVLMEQQQTSKSTTIGLVLIMAIFFIWMIWMQKSSVKNTPPKTPAVAADTSARSANPGQPIATSSGSTATDSAVPGMVNSSASTPDASKTISTPLFTAILSSHGGSLKSLILTKYLTYAKKPLDLVNQADYHGGDVNLKFVGQGGKTVSTFDLPFSFDSSSVHLGEHDSVSITATYMPDSGHRIEKIFDFNGGLYLIGIRYRLSGMQNMVAGYQYNATVDNPLPYVEQRTVDETNAAKSFAGVPGDMEEFIYKKPSDPQNTKSINGEITYIGSRTQYFTEALIPVWPKTTQGLITGKAVTMPEGGVVEKYAMSVSVPISRGNTDSLAFKYYMGPLEYNRIEALGVGLEGAMNFGWSFLVRPISIHIMMPFFLWLHGFMSNWGLVIIVFSIVIKLLTVPLSTGQMKSMRKMQVLQPRVAEVREKYKDDNSKMNEELLKLYRTYGVNPAGGCLPLLLQMPILFALYSVLRNVIELRQAPFAFWIQDLSIPDALFHFGTSLPLIGAQLSGLTLLLVITMFVQQLFTVTDPRQKSMAYIMPIIFIFMFNNLPSGVALYYFMFNIFGLSQQIYLTKIAKPLTLEEMKVDPKKAKGGFMAKLQDMEKSARDTRQQQYQGKGKK